MSENETGKGSIVDKIFCKELLILLVGVVMLVSGFYTGQEMQYFWGVTIILGAVLLHFVRKKDWKQHWEDQERFRQAMEERRKREKGEQ